MSTILPVSVDNKLAYNIHVSFNFDGLLENTIKIKPDKSTKICVFVDKNVDKYYSQTIVSTFSSFYNDVLIYRIPAGEQYKNLETIGGLYEFLINSGFERKDLLVALGGGVIGDMTGFAAATYLRGIDYIQIPTTLLAQVDSSIGGKTAVDFSGYKNMVGAFYYPKLVFINVDVLSTLPEEQFICGMGEVIKYGFIQDKEFYNYLTDNTKDINSRNQEALNHIIITCCRCKKIVVEEDPTEKGLRAILNFGHTIGHAIESLSNFTMFHGQCVSIGMVGALHLSLTKGFLDIETVENAISTLESFNLPTSVSGMDIEAVLNATKSDKKMSGGHIKFILLESIGRAFISEEVSETDLINAIKRVVV